MKKLWLIFLSPFIASAAAPSTFSGLVNYFTGLITLATPIVGALALLAFFKGLTQFIAKSGDEKSHTEGKNLMIWGIIALFLMVSFIGIVTMLKTNLGFKHGLPLLP